MHCATQIRQRPKGAQASPFQFWSSVSVMNFKNPYFNVFTAAFTCGAALTCSTSAIAQTAQNTSGALSFDLGTLVLHGENVDRKTQDTSSSVTGLTGNRIESRTPGATTVTEALNSVPNVAYTDTVSAPIIRGLDSQGPHNGAVAFFAGTVPRATINLDGQYLGYNQYFFGATSVWDVDSVEVYRGPQTIAQGANAIAGSIVVNTKDPTFEPEGAYRFELGSLNTRRASLAYSAAIAPDLAARVSLDYAGRDTFISYSDPTFDESVDQDFSSFTGRVKLLWQPTEIPGLSAKLTYSHNTSNRPTAESASPDYDDLVSIAPTNPSWYQKTDTIIADVDYEFDSGVSLYNQLVFVDTEATRDAGGVNQGDANLFSKNYSYETRLTFGDVDTGTGGVVGLYVAQTEADETLYLASRTGDFVSSFDDQKTNLGLFGEVTHNFNDQWSLTGGLRFQRDRIERSGNSVFATQTIDFDETYSEVLPRISVAYSPNEDVTLGALVSKGYNPGGISLNFNTGEWTEFDKETSINYEVFARARFMDDRLFVTGNLFYTDLKNHQLNLPVEVASGVFQSYTINAEDAASYGLEIGAEFEVNDRLRLNGNLGLLKTDLQSVSANTSAEGNEFSQAPSYMIGLGADWAITDRFSLGGQVRLMDGYYSDIANTEGFEVDGFAIADLNASYQLNNGLELYGYVKNVFDETAPVRLRASRSTAGAFVSGSLTQPRTIGFGVRGTF